MIHLLPTLPHPTGYLTWASFSNVADFMGNLFLIKSGERVFYSIILFIYMNYMVIGWSHSFLLIFRGEKWVPEINTYSDHEVLFYNSAVQHSRIRYEHHMIICSALCALYITCNLSLKIVFQELSASLKVKDCIFVVFKLFITMS